MSETKMKNHRGEWVPAIPEPYPRRIRKECCQCGRRFWTRRAYLAHYAYVHILAGESGRNA